MKKTGKDKTFDLFNTLLLTAFVVAVIYPLIYVLSASFSSPAAVGSGRVWFWPVEPSLRGYQAVFRNSNIMLGYRNSFFYMGAGTAVSLALTFMAAYPLSRRDLRGRGWLTFLMVFTMMFSGGLIPYYLLVRSLGMLDTRWAMIMPRAIGVWNVMIMRAYLQANIPDELLEASQLDGCSDLRFMVQVVMPLSKPVFAVIALYYAVAQWNTFFHALIFLTRKELMPLQMFLRDILIQNTQSGEMLDIETAEMMQSLAELLKYSVIVVASAPVLAIYPFAQRYFVKGVMIGALKG